MLSMCTCHERVLMMQEIMRSKDAQCNTETLILSSTMTLFLSTKKIDISALTNLKLLFGYLSFEV